MTPETEEDESGKDEPKTGEAEKQPKSGCRKLPLDESVWMTVEGKATLSCISEFFYNLKPSQLTETQIKKNATKEYNSAF